MSEWRAACEGEENIVKEAKILAYMKWKEVKKLVEEVLDKILEEAEKNRITYLKTKTLKVLLLNLL